jgi:hypothetical protein
MFIAYGESAVGEVTTLGGADIITDLAAGHEEAQGAAIRIGNSMKLGIHAAFGAADQAPDIPLFTARLDAVRCVTTEVEPSYSSSEYAASALAPSTCTICGGRSLGSVGKAQDYRVLTGFTGTSWHCHPGAPTSAHRNGK